MDLQELLEKQSLARRCLQVKPLQHEEEPKIQLRDQAKAFSFISRSPYYNDGGGGRDITSFSAGDSRTPGSFAISIGHEEQEVILDGLISAEDDAFLRLLRSAAGARLYDTLRTIECFERARIQVEQHRIVGTVLLVPRTEVKAWVEGLGTGFNAFPAEQQALGDHGEFFGATIRSATKEVNDPLQSGEAFILSEPEWLGALYEFGPLEKQAAKIVLDNNIVPITVYREVIGLLLSDTRSICRLQGLPLNL